MDQQLIQSALSYGRRFVRYGKPASYIPELASKDPSKQKSTRLNSSHVRTSRMPSSA